LHWHFLVENITKGVHENGRWSLDHAWHERWLNKLEVELLLGVTADDGAAVADIELKVVRNLEGLVAA
jgi:hypothetical protein